MMKSAIYKGDSLNRLFAVNVSLFHAYNYVLSNLPAAAQESFNLLELKQFVNEPTTWHICEAKPFYNTHFLNIIEVAFQEKTQQGLTNRHYKTISPDRNLMWFNIKFDHVTICLFWLQSIDT